jgi:hypothetical protein
MSENVEPLAITIAKTLKITDLSNSSVYKLINDGVLETVVVAGRRLVIYESVKRVLGIRPPGEPPAPPGLTGGPIKLPPGRRRKPRAETSANRPTLAVPGQK